MQKKTYKSRVSILLVMLIVVICMIPIIFVPKEDYLVFLAVMSPIVCAVILPLFSIKYVIDGNTLRICSMWIFHNDIDIRTIKMIEPSRSILSAPAASLNRLKISYGKYDEVLVSPRYQDDFIKTINEIISQNAKTE